WLLTSDYRRHWPSLPENNVQNRAEQQNSTGHDAWALVPGKVPGLLSRGQRVDQADQLLLFPGLGKRRHYDGDHKTDRKSPNRLIEIIGHRARVMDDAASVQEIMRDRARNAGQQACERGVGRGPLPEHAEQKNGEKRRIEE